MKRFAGTLHRSTWAGLALALGMAAAVLGWLLHERGQAIDEARDRAALLARVLDAQSARSLDAAARTLEALAQAPGAEPGGPALQRAVEAQSTLRAVVLLDRRGRVLAASGEAEAGLQLAPDRLGPLPQPGQTSLGPWHAGGGLRALAAPARPPRSAAVPGDGAAVPLLHALGGPQGLVLLGLVDTGALGRQMQDLLGREPGAALLADRGGRLLAVAGAGAPQPGAQLPPSALAPLPGARVGAAQGAEGEHALAVHAASRWPVTTLVQLPLEPALEPWRRLVAVFGGLGAAGVAAMLAMTAAMARSRRARDRAQAEVAARERELGLLVAGVQELIFRTDAQGRLTFMSPYWQTVSAVPPHELLGRPFAACVASGSQAAAQALFAPSADRAADRRRAQLALGDERGLRQFDVQVQVLLEQGRCTGFIGSAVDVSDRLAGQALLREQLAFNELLLEMLPLPVSMLDARGCYVLVNQAWEEMTGRDRSAVLGLPARQFMLPHDAALHDARDRELLALGEGGRLRYESTLVTRHGARRDLAITKAAVPGPDGRPGGVLVAFMDVTEQREVERAVREARDAAEEASRAKSEFIANISHELRTPLQSIIGFSELGEHRGRDTPRLASMFADIHAAGQRMLALVNDLLDVSKIESTVGTFHLERTDLRPLVREVARELEPLLAARELRVHASLGGLPLVAKVDPMRLQQVVRNVLANAIRFSPTGAAIDVHGELTADNEIELSVRDRGPGIPATELESIFEAFVQSTRTKDGSGGTGLGLAICRKIVEAHGGRIVAANAADGGSVFRITLPARSGVDTQPGAL